MMKTIKFFFIILFFSAFFTEGLKSQTVERTTSSISVYPVRCEGVVIDLLRGVIVNHTLVHYKDGIPDWYKVQLESAEVVSLLTGEVFEMSYHQKQDGPGWLEPIVIVTRRFNIVGNMGSHYMMSEIMHSDFTGVVPPNQPVNTYLKQECKCWE